MVKLFKKSSENTETFKFETSIKLKSLPIEEYAHVAYAFQVAMLRFERMLKESLLEGYVTSTTLEKISRELNITEIRDLQIPDTPSIIEIFGSEAPSVKAKEAAPALKTQEVISKPISKPIAPKDHLTPSIPPTPTPILTPISDLTTPSEEVPTTPPKISFSFPESTSEPIIKPTSKSTSEPSTKPSPTPPVIPKISFPSLSKSADTPPTNPFTESKGRREEDRATGIAILRKQMLTELKKIRSVVSEDQR